MCNHGLYGRSSLNATGPSRHVTVFAKQPVAIDNEHVLGSTGGPCVELDEYVNAGPIQSFLFNVPIIYSIRVLITRPPKIEADALI
jgi:hypothetical protein